MDCPASAGPSRGVIGRRVLPFIVLDDAEIEILAGSLELGIDALRSTKLQENRSLITGFEDLIDRDVRDRISRAIAAPKKDIARERHRLTRFLGSVEHRLTIALAAAVDPAPASAAVADAARRMDRVRLKRLLIDLAILHDDAVQDVEQLRSQGARPGRRSIRDDDAVFATLAALLADAGIETAIAEIGNVDERGPYFRVACFVCRAVLRRLEAAAILRIGGAGLAADRLRKTLTLSPETLAKRLRRARRHEIPP